MHHAQPAALSRNSASGPSRLLEIFIYCHVVNMIDVFSFLWTDIDELSVTDLSDYELRVLVAGAPDPVRLSSALKCVDELLVILNVIRDSLISKPK